MNIVKLIKRNVPRLPYSIGNLLAKIPYHRRPLVGSVYRERKRQIAEFEQLNEKEQRDFVFDRIRNVVAYAYENVPFYTRHYQECCFHPDDLKDFECLQKVPIISKKDLLKADIEERSGPDAGNRVLVNTGGSTGSPLSFYIQTDSYGHEKAHMDRVWGKLGYTNLDSTLTFSGRSKSKHPVQYDGLRHAFMVDIYQPFEAVIEELERLIRKNRMPRFLHGYPSAIHDFLAQIELQRPDFAAQLRLSIDGTLFGSEFPNPQWRSRIESATSAPSVSWYGHTERCVLAYEAKEPFAFEPLQSYGYAEAINLGGTEQLVGTSFYNFSSPLIRYNTEDGVQSLDKRGDILRSFKIVDGRNGEFILDRNSKKIPLTGLIYGRHHRLFDFCRSLQISQDSPGESTIHYCLLPGTNLPEDASSLFDTSNVEIGFSFLACDSPVRSSAGKIGLLIKSKST